MPCSISERQQVFILPVNLSDNKDNLLKYSFSFFASGFFCPGFVSSGLSGGGWGYISFVLPEVSTRLLIPSFAMTGEYLGRFTFNDGQKFSQLKFLVASLPDLHPWRSIHHQRKDRFKLENGVVPRTTAHRKNHQGLDCSC